MAGRGVVLTVNEASFARATRNHMAADAGFRCLGSELKPSVGSGLDDTAVVASDGGRVLGLDGGFVVELADADADALGPGPAVEERPEKPQSWLRVAELPLASRMVLRIKSRLSTASMLLCALVVGGGCSCFCGLWLRSSCSCRVLCGSLWFPSGGL